MKQERTTIRVTPGVYYALGAYAAENGAFVSRLASVAIANWLREQGVEVDDPRDAWSKIKRQKSREYAA